MAGPNSLLFICMTPFICRAPLISLCARITASGSLKWAFCCAAGEVYCAVGNALMEHAQRDGVRMRASVTLAVGHNSLMHVRHCIQGTAHASTLGKAGLCWHKEFPAASFLAHRLP